MLTSLATAVQWAQMVASFATVMVAIAAGFWFFFSARYSKRVEFDVETEVFKSSADDFNIVQLKFSLDNKGQVIHRCYTLAFEVVEMRFDGTSVSNPESGYVFRSGNVVDEEAEYYYVRPGVQQRIVYTVSIPSRIALLKVRAFFTYANHRLEIDRSRPITPQRLALPDWTALVRVVQVPNAKSNPHSPASDLVEPRPSHEPSEEQANAVF